MACFPHFRSAAAGTRNNFVAARQSLARRRASLKKICVGRGAILIPVLLLLCVRSGAAKTLDELAQSRAEKFLVASLRKTGQADLSRFLGGQRAISAKLIEAILFDAESSKIPSEAIRISDAVVEGVVSSPYMGGTVTRDVEFLRCTFDEVKFRRVTFERSLMFDGAKGIDRLSLDGVHVKGYLDLIGITPRRDWDLRVDLSNARVDGVLAMKDLERATVTAHHLSVHDLLVLAGNLDESIDLSQLEAESVRIRPAFQQPKGHLRSLSLMDASIRGSLLIQNAEIDEYVGSGLRVGGLTEIEGSKFRGLDFSWANLGSFRWVLPQCADQDACWPARARVAGVAFRELNIVPYKPAASEDASADQTPQSTLPGDPRLGIEFFSHAEFSESGYGAYEQSLRSRGLITEADDVNRAMRDHKRDQTWRESKGFFGKLAASVYIALDLGQKVFLGYGRSALPPLLWSLAFVAFGTVVFWNEKHMEASGEQPPRYSAFWYSLELFLPVVDLGVAKSWRPSQKSFPLLTYARIHQLAGWILIPVSLAALTGAFK